jgi:hypothetical protein
MFSFYVGRKRYRFGYLSLLSVLFIDGIGRKVNPVVVLLAPLLALIICMSVIGCISVIPPNSFLSVASVLVTFTWSPTLGLTGICGYSALLSPLQ